MGPLLSRVRDGPSISTLEFNPFLGLPKAINIELADNILVLSSNIAH